MTKQEKNLILNGKPVNFSYTNQVTPIEHTFLSAYFKKQDYDGLIYYLEDCVLWKRQEYFEVKEDN